MNVIDKIVAFINQEFKGFKRDSFDFREIAKSSFCGFFPYRNGFLNEKFNLNPSQCILILGQDFGTVDYLDKTIENKDELGQPTCLNLVKIFPTELQSQVFLSNVFIGLRDSKKRLVSMGCIRVMMEII